LDLYFRLYYIFFCAVDRLLGIAAIGFLSTLGAWSDLLHRRRDFSQFIRLRKALGDEFWKGSTPFSHYHKMVRDWHESAAVAVLYHRLGLPRWKKRFRVVGPLPQSHPEWGKRPVIFTFIHTGPFGILCYWLRSQGIAVASLTGGLPLIVYNRHYYKIFCIGDKRFGLENIPYIFQGQGALRDCFRFLTPGHALLMALDGGKLGEESERCDAGGHSILLRQGAVRMAAQTNALLIPISVRRMSPCRFEIHFRAPVPDELIDKHDPIKANQHIISDLWPDIKDHPTDLNWTTLEELAPSLRADRIGWP
jgi:lauroyl/myristoyl acyltransferase